MRQPPKDRDLHVAELRDLQPDEQAMERLEAVSEPIETYLDFMQGNHFMRRMADLED